MLADRGLTLAGGRGARERMAQALAGVSCTSRVTIAETTGWRDRAFVLPHRTIAKAGQEPVVYLGREAVRTLPRRAPSPSGRPRLHLSRRAPPAGLCPRAGPYWSAS
jgi:hypothetical protein